MERVLNSPIWKIGTYPVYWLHEVKTSHWICRACSKRQEPGSISFELCVRFARRKADAQGVKDEAVKMFVCLPCAISNLEAAATECKMVHNLGPAAYRMFKKV
jgi:hypothetical protein